MRTPHTATRQGKRVFVQLKNGERFVDRFVTRTGNKVVIFEQRGRVPVGDIKSFSNFKPQPRKWNGIG